VTPPPTDGALPGATGPNVVALVVAFLAAFALAVFALTPRSARRKPDKGR